MDDTAIAVFTGKPTEDILNDGGSGAWVLNPANAKRRKYLVCCRKGSTLHQGEASGAVFLVGRIADLVPVGTATGRDPPRYFISISHYALTDLPDVWRNWRNPVRYTSLTDLGVELDTLEFVLVAGTGKIDWKSTLPPKAVRRLTIAEAKEGLAAMFGVDPEQVEITIKA